MDIAELLTDVASALTVMVGDQTRHSHLEAINLALSDQSLQAPVAEALRRASAAMESEMGVDPMILAMGKRKEARKAGLALSALVPVGSAQYLYHGTVFGAINSIAESGLLPGHAPVWRRNSYHRANSDEAVFFTTDWRSAVMWSQAAHLFGRGPRASLKRSPVVLRVVAGPIRAEPDPVAGHRSCVKVRATVGASDADVLVDLRGGLPVWRPILEVSALRSPPHDIVPDLKPGPSVFP